MKWLLKKYMANAHIDKLTELAELTGMNRKVLYDRINHPEGIRGFEIKALDDVLHFSDADIASLVRGKI